MSHSTLPLLLLTLPLVACTTLRDRADTSYARGDFLAAAATYDQVLAKDPGDAATHLRRAEARNAALRHLLSEAQAARQAGDGEAAAAALERLLAIRDGWRIQIEQRLAASLASALHAAAARTAAASATALATTGPLAAERVAAGHPALLGDPELSADRAAIAAPIHAAGRAVCEALPTDGGAPAWGWLRARYCAHWGVTVASPPRSALSSGVRVAGAIAGATAAQTARVTAALEGGLRASAWYAPDGAAPLPATLGGSLAAAFGSHAVARSAAWVEQVPYSADESHEESYQEPYDDTESYTESVPHTEYQSETHACGDTTCTDQVPVTVYSTEFKTRTVTKYRTAWRTVTTQVTKYRDEPRVFTYEATARTGDYASALEVTLPTLAVTAQAQARFSAAGVDHDVTFAPAGVAPERANLMTLDDLATRAGDDLRDELHRRLDAAYAARFCAGDAYTRDQAAACAYLDLPSAPSAVHATLRAAFGGDEANLAPLLRR
jgi:hypothetical protein